MPNIEEWWEEDKYLVEAAWGHEPKFLANVPVIVAEAERLGRKKGIEECVKIILNNKMVLTADMPWTVKFALPAYNLAHDDLLVLLSKS